MDFTITKSALGLSSSSKQPVHSMIQRVIDECHEQGGGIVRIHSGIYLCGTIYLRSNVHLHLEPGAVLYSIDQPEFFPEICKTPYGNLPGQIQALITADNVENVSITGGGTIDGGKNVPLSSDESVSHKFRPALLFLKNCKNLSLKDITLQYSSFWTLHLLKCQDVTIHSVNIYAHQDRINTDGIDPDGCTNVIISDCHIKTGDDCIVIKSTEGDKCENIVVNNCILSSSCAALKIGTEAIGPIRNVSFNNCAIHNTAVALSLFMKDGSSYENIFFTNMQVSSTSQYPIFIDNTPRYYKDPKKGSIKNIFFSNVTVDSPGKLYIEGLPDHPVTNVQIHNLTWTITGALDPSLRKPGGARRQEPDPNAIQYGVNPYQIVLVNVADSSFSGIRIYSQDNKPISDRGFLFANNFSESKIQDTLFRRDPNSAIPLQNLENVSKVQLDSD